MKVFIMWSGEKSKRVATRLKYFMRAVVQRPNYFISTDDIHSGSVWENVIAGELETTHFGIACLTKENLNNPWMHFEAGAISKVSKRAVLVPYLLDIDASDVTGPLTKFQFTNADRAGTLSLVESINSSQDQTEQTDSSAINAVFEALWPDFEKVVYETIDSPEEIDESSRSQDDILREILNHVRDFSRNSKQHIQTDIIAFREEVQNLKNELFTHGYDIENTRSSKSPISFSHLFNGKDIEYLVHKANLLGGKKDGNAKNWSHIASMKRYYSIEGDWSSRWNIDTSPQKWFNGMTKIIRSSEYVILLFQSNQPSSIHPYLIIARRVDVRKLHGRYINLDSPNDSTPWVGLIVNNKRIDGVWKFGRWDFRR